MPYSLQNRNVLVTGGSRGLGELICEKFAAEGCNVAINYLSSEDRAKVVAQKVERHGAQALLVQGDVSLEADCVNIVKKTISAFGGLDVIISNAGYTRFSEFADLNATTIDDWDRTFACNVKAQVFLLREAVPTFNANAEGGVFIMTSSIAARTTGGSSMPYSVSKAAQIHLMRCLASTQGPKIRVNAVLPGLLKTEWGLQYGAGAISMLEDKAWLKKATDLNDTAQAFIDIARNTSMTGQRIQVDSGLGQND